MALVGFLPETDHPRVIKEGKLFQPEEFDLSTTSLDAMSNRADFFAHLLPHFEVSSSGVSSMLFSCVDNSERTLHLSFLTGFGLVADVYSDRQSAARIHNRIIHGGVGPLVLAGEYHTDGAMLHRMTDPVEGDRLPITFYNASHFASSASVRLWLRNDTIEQERIDRSVVSVALPELDPALLVSYAAVSEVLGISTNSLRSMVSRGEGLEVPNRQAQTDQGHPLWSRPIIEGWVKASQYDVYGVKLHSQLRSASGGDFLSPHLEERVCDRLIHSEAIRFISAERKRVESLGFRVTPRPADYGYTLSGAPVVVPDDVGEAYGDLRVQKVREPRLPWP